MVGLGFHQVTNFMSCCRRSFVLFLKLGLRDVIVDIVVAGGYLGRHMHLHRLDELLSGKFVVVGAW
jgi:hypothetical protein